MMERSAGLKTLMAEQREEEKEECTYSKLLIIICKNLIVLALDPHSEIFMLNVICSLN